MKARILKAARNELREATAYYDRQRKGLGRELRAEVRTGISKIREHPTAWPMINERYRHFQTNRFPYGIFYEVRKKEIVIVAIAHLHREPGYWQSRVEGEENQ